MKQLFTWYKLMPNAQSNRVRSTLLFGFISTISADLNVSNKLHIEETLSFTKQILTQLAV